MVVLGTDKADAARSRFDAAHELGHLVCHPEGDPGGAQEQQAHAFAAELLMPRSHLADLLPRRFDLGAYARLKDDWGVSIRALLYRARTLAVISDPAYRRGVVLLNQRYGRSEPYPLRTVEAPLLLAEAVRVAGASGVAAQRIASEAGIAPGDLEAILGQGDPRPEVTVGGDGGGVEE